MAYDPTLPTPTDRVRFALGDTGATSILPGGETAYEALLARLGGDEVRVYRAAAGTLASIAANLPASVGSGGESVSWIDRAAHWRKVAAGSVPYPFSADGSGAAAAQGGASALEPVW